MFWSREDKIQVFIDSFKASTSWIYNFLPRMNSEMIPKQKLLIFVQRLDLKQEVGRYSVFERYKHPQSWGKRWKINF